MDEPEPARRNLQQARPHPPLDILDNIGLEPLDDFDAAAGGFDYDDELDNGIIY